MKIGINIEINKEDLETITKTFLEFKKGEREERKHIRKEKFKTFEEKLDRVLNNVKFR